MFLKVNSVKKSFNGQIVADSTDLCLEKGELGALLGPSGCGKTTLLRMIAGFEKPDDGEIEINGETFFSQETFVPPEKRSIGIVFQDYALFPHMTVRDNIAFGLRTSKRKARKKVDSLMELVNLSHIAKKYPHQISGGQQQRVALARAIAPEPSLLLLDEPFSSLDVSLRESLSMEVRNLLKKIGITALMVTHNQQEAFSLADKVGILMDGKIQQWGDAESLYYRPASKNVAQFIGEGVVIKGQVLPDNRIKTEMGVLETIHPATNGNKEVDVLLRPEAISFDQTSSIKADALTSFFRGPGKFYSLKLPSGTVVNAVSQSDLDIAAGTSCGVALNKDHVVVL